MPESVVSRLTRLGGFGAGKKYPVKKTVSLVVS